MSEPVSNAEIEDVLSSIRRLVSNDVEAAKEPAPSASTEAEPAGKLILTADFRVSESQPESQPEPEPQPEPEDFHSEIAEDVETSEVDATEVEVVVVEAVEVEAAEVETAEIETTEVETAQAEINDDDWQEEREPAPADEAPLEFHHTEHRSNAPAEAEIAQGESNDVWQDPAEQITEDGADSTPTLEDTIADLEAAIGQQKGEWEPDGSDFEEDADAEEVMSEPVQDWIDGTAQEVGVTSEDTVTADEDDPDLFGVEESVIDEETLRDMVSDIVRQELQGALGERITRNVRKLVRREINRVLASQDFD